MIEAESTIPKSQLSNEKESPDRVHATIEAIANDPPHPDHATEEADDPDERPSARDVTFRAIGPEFAAVADVPGGIRRPGEMSNLEWAMRDNFECIVDDRYGGSDHADLELWDLCSVGRWAAMHAERLRKGSSAEKRRTPGWRVRLRALTRLQTAAFKAASRIGAKTYHGIVAKALSDEYAKGDPRRPDHRPLRDGILLDYARLVCKTPDQTTTA